ncbi:MAG: class I SAM-dependent methyltransferase [Acidobacteria bacterium]|nr:class I SAM-dependent methyltransferase [Acidobacteriota bacterium]
MPIGEEYAVLSPRLEANRGHLRYLLMRACYSAYYFAYGTPELHTHTRWRAVRSLLTAGPVPDRAFVLEIGCGHGIMSFRVARKHKHWKVVGVDADRQSIELADLAKARNGIDNVEFRTHLAPRLEVVPSASCDAVLLIDVIEHVKEDTALLSEVYRVLKPGGFVLLSVPTPNYPRVFGWHFHKAVGHVRDGYRQDQLESIVRECGFEVGLCRPYTYPPSASGCFIFYRWLLKIHGLPTILSPLLDLICRLDCVWPVRTERFACSIALKASKPTKLAVSANPNAARAESKEALPDSI